MYTLIKPLKPSKKDNCFNWIFREKVYEGTQPFSKN